MKNFKQTAVILSALLLSGLSATVLFAQAEDYNALLGTWDVELTEMGMQLEFVFKMENDTLVGEMNFDMGSAELTDIVFKEGTLTFTAAVDAGGQTMDIEVEAKIEEEKITGLIFSEMGEAEISGTKRKDD